MDVMDTKLLTDKIREYIKYLDFEDYRIIAAKKVDERGQYLFQNWIDRKYHADMEYMSKNMDKRLNPKLLVEGAKSIIIFAMNHYPSSFQSQNRPQIAYYAYGKDYHDVVKSRLRKLFTYIQSLDSEINGRFFCDTAPFPERYWAAKAKLGWIGKNSLLILPKKGSYYFIGSLILDIELEFDDLDAIRLPNCSNCSRCMDACPTQAIVEPGVVDSNRCLSYQTIENKGDIELSFCSKMNNRLYGCDICQQVCPWNRFATSTPVADFAPNEELLNLSLKDITNLSPEDYHRIFKGSAMKRAKLAGLQRNARMLELDK